MSETMDITKGQDFIAAGFAWRACGEPRDEGGVIGVVVRARRLRYGGDGYVDPGGDPMAVPVQSAEPFDAELWGFLYLSGEREPAYGLIREDEL